MIDSHLIRLLESFQSRLVSSGMTSRSFPGTSKPVPKQAPRGPQVTGLRQVGTPTGRQIAPRRRNANVNAPPSTPTSESKEG